MSTRRLTLYRDDSTVQVVFEGVKHFFWTAGNTVLVIAQLTDRGTGAHRYVHWHGQAQSLVAMLRERGLGNLYALWCNGDKSPGHVLMLPYTLKPFKYIYGG